MPTLPQLLVYAAVGAFIALILLRVEDKFNNQQYSRGQYIKAAVAGFVVTLVPLLLLSRLIPDSQSGGGATLRAPMAAKPMHAPYMAPQPPGAGQTSGSDSGGLSTSTINNSSLDTSGASAVFTPIINSITPKMQYRTNGPTF